jgi:uncharacterized protein YxjI
MHEDVDKIIFDDKWEFVTESDIPAKVVTKLNQWKHNYILCFISVKWEKDELCYLIARKKK